jgi:hypothetical protein
MRPGAHQDMRATNTFWNADEVKAAAHPVRVVANALELNLPKQAISQNESGGPVRRIADIRA